MMICLVAESVKVRHWLKMGGAEPHGINAERTQQPESGKTLRLFDILTFEHPPSIFRQANRHIPRKQNDLERHYSLKD